VNIVAAGGATGTIQFDAPPFFCYNIWRDNIKMSIKLTLLKSGETLISDIRELVSQDSETGEKEAVAYLLNKPHRVAVRTEVLLTEDIVDDTRREVQVSLSPWIVLSADEDITIPVDWVVTAVEPLSSVKQMYEEKING
jgi:hypothetical protein